MNQIERLARIDEINRFDDWLMNNDTNNHNYYAHTRASELDAGAGPIRPGEELEVNINGHTYLVEVKKHEQA